MTRRTESRNDAPLLHDQRLDQLVLFFGALVAAILLLLLAAGVW